MSTSSSLLPSSALIQNPNQQTSLSYTTTATNTATATSTWASSSSSSAAASSSSSTANSTSLSSSSSSTPDSSSSSTISYASSSPASNLGIEDFWSQYYSTAHEIDIQDLIQSLVEYFNEEYELPLLSYLRSTSSSSPSSTFSPSASSLDVNKTRNQLHHQYICVHALLTLFVSNLRHAEEADQTYQQFLHQEQQEQYEHKQRQLEEVNAAQHEEDELKVGNHAIVNDDEEKAATKEMEEEDEEGEEEELESFWRQSITLTQLRAFVNCFGKQFHQAFIVAQENLFHVQDYYLYPWYQCSSAFSASMIKNKDQSHTFSIYCNEETHSDFLVDVYAVKSAQLVARFGLRYELNSHSEIKDYTAKSIGKWRVHHLYRDKNAISFSFQLPSLNSEYTTLNDLVLDLLFDLTPLDQPQSLQALRLHSPSLWPLHCLFYTIANNDIQSLRLFLQAEQYYRMNTSSSILQDHPSHSIHNLLQQRDEYGLNAIHVACCFNRSRVLACISPLLPVSMLAETTYAHIDSYATPALSQASTTNYFQPYFKTTLATAEASSAGTIACRYQSHSCLSFLAAWLASKGVVGLMQNDPDVIIDVNGVKNLS